MCREANRSVGILLHKLLRQPWKHPHSNELTNRCFQETSGGITLQGKKGKGLAGIKLQDEVVQQQVGSSDRQNKSEEDAWLWGEIAATTELIADFLSCTADWEGLEVWTTCLQSCDNHCTVLVRPVTCNSSKVFCKYRRVSTVHEAIVQNASKLALGVSESIIGDIGR